MNYNLNNSNSTTGPIHGGMSGRVGGSVKIIRKELKENIDLKTNPQKFFKEKVKAYGVKVSIVTNISKKSFNEIKNFSKKEIFKICEELLKSGYLEESFVAFKWIDYMSKDLEKEDFKVFERWLSKYVDNWASCDTLCNYGLGHFLEMYPEFTKQLKKWTKSNNRWVKRGSIVTLVFPAKKGLFLKEILEISKKLMNSKDDLVQKGYGWALKEASRKHQKYIFAFVMENKKNMPRTALRYAIELMPKELKKEAMKK